MEQTAIYHLVNEVSGMALLAGQWGRDPNAHEVVQYPLTHIRGQKENSDGFKWLFIPADNDHYFIINQVSGFALLAGQWGRDPNAHEVVQYPVSHTRGQEENIEGFHWELKRQPNGTYQITNSMSQFGLLAGQWGRDPNAHEVVQYPLSHAQGKDENIRGFNWSLKKVGSISLPKPLDKEEPPIAPTLTSVNKPPEFDKNVYLAKTSYLPCWMVEPEKTLEWKLKNSPYYVLERKQRYRRAGWYHNTTTEEHKYTKKIASGFSEANSKSFTIQTGISTTAEVSAGVEGVASGKVATTVSVELGFTEEQTLSTMRAEEDIAEAPVPPGSTVALYILSSHYYLRRKDKTLVKDWVINDTIEFEAVSYPPGFSV